MDGDHVLLEGDVPCRYSYAYGCVMGHGVVEFLREDEERCMPCTASCCTRRAGMRILPPAWSVPYVFCVLRWRLSAPNFMRARNHLLPVDGFFMTGEIAPLFVRWSLPHWAALGIVALAAGGLLWGCRRLRMESRLLVGKVLGSLFLLTFLMETFGRIVREHWEPWQDRLPLHFAV